MLTADRLSWPGVDHHRARAAAVHLERAGLRLFVALLVRGHDTGGRSELELVREGLEASRLARGFLGAVGFERRGRL